MGKMIESGGREKNAQGLMITITIVKFVWISGFARILKNKVLQIKYYMLKNICDWGNVNENS